MDKITWQDLPSTSTPLNASNLNTMQSNIEKSVVAIGSTAPSTTEKFWVQKGKNLIDTSKIMLGAVTHGTGVFNYLTYAAVTDYIPVESGSYHLHLFNAGTGSNRILVFRITGYDANKNYLWDDSDLDTTDRTISGSTTRYLRICFAINGYQTISSLDTIKNSQPQLEVGTSATTFESFVSPRIMAKTNDAFGQVYRDNDNDRKEIAITSLSGGATINGTYWKNELIKQGNICHLELAFAPNSTTNITIYQLPAGFFNTGNSATVALCMRNNLVAKAVITNSGAVQVQVPSASGDTWSLNATWTVY